MKKLLIVFAMVLTTVCLYAESFTVKTVVGKVTVQNGKNTWEQVTEGSVLKSDKTINVSLNSVLVLVDEKGVELSIKANQKGTVESLVEAVRNRASGIQKATITTSTVESATTSNSKGIATAASRADDVTDDIEWDE